MYKKFVVILFLFLIRLNCVGQGITFQRTYDTLGCYYANDIVQFLDNSYFLCGGSYTANINDGNVIRLDSLGNIVWVNTYSSPGVDGVTQILISPDSNLIVAAIFQQYSVDNGKLLISKISPVGVIVWTNTYQISGGCYPRDLINTRDGGFLITGYSFVPSNNLSDVFLSKFNTQGILLWTKIYNFSPGEGANSVAELSNGDLILAGSTGIAGTPDAYIIKTDSVGDMLWTKVLGYTNVDEFTSVKVTPDSFLVFAGYSYDTVNNNYNCYLVKSDLDGTIIFEKFIGNQYENVSADLLIRGNNYYIAGTTNSPQNYNFELTQTDTSGDTLSVNNYGGNGSQILTAFFSTNDGGFVMVGYDFITDDKMLVIKVDNQNNLLPTLISKFDKLLFEAYPNPCSSILTISGLINNEKLELIDLFGNLVLSLQFPKDVVTTDVSNVKSGVYFLRYGNDNLSYFTKILIVH